MLPLLLHHRTPPTTTRKSQMSPFVGCVLCVCVYCFRSRCVLLVRLIITGRAHSGPLLRLLPTSALCTPATLRTAARLSNLSHTHSAHTFTQHSTTWLECAPECETPNKWLCSLRREFINKPKLNGVALCAIASAAWCLCCGRSRLNIGHTAHTLLCVCACA